MYGELFINNEGNAELMKKKAKNTNDIMGKARTQNTKKYVVNLGKTCVDKKN